MSLYPGHATAPLKKLQQREARAEAKERRAFAWPYEVCSGWEDWTQACTACRAEGAQKYYCADGNNYFLCDECKRKPEPFGDSHE